jgi:hypothetical protein
MLHKEITADCEEKIALCSENRISAVNVIVQWICSSFQTMFGEKGTVLCLFNLKLLDTRFTYL